MGLFLSFSLVLHSVKQKVAESLNDYVKKNSGGLIKEEIEYGDPNFCLITDVAKFTLVTYPDMFTEYSQLSDHISGEQFISTFTFSIYDGDYWSLNYHENGKLISRFNPYPNYWSKKKERDQVKSWNFSLVDICNKLGCDVNVVEKYFTEWSDLKNKSKAYVEDEFHYGDCFQVFDFLKKIGISYNNVTNIEGSGETYKLYTEKFPLHEDLYKGITFEDIRNSKKFTTSYLRLKPEDIELLLGVGFNFFIEYSTKKQNCEKCHTYDRSSERLDLDYYLSITERAIITTGFCNKCYKKMDSGWGLTNIKNLLLFLNT